MDIDNPFETFQKSAFRLEALPQYLVDEEREDFEAFRDSGRLPVSFDSEWGALVGENIRAGKTMQRLRLLSTVLSDYEKFETHIYTGPSAGEVIRAAYREDFVEKYKYDFWLFDDRWIARMEYGDNGVFVRFDIREATADEMEYAHYWQGVFSQSELIDDLLHKGR